MVWYFVVLLVMSLATFVTYGWDKRQAKLQQQRVPEQKLHVLAMLGGWPGAFAGQQYFRHKTQKLGFLVITWLIAISHVLAIAGYLWVSNSN
jgi:uncharacterized membrane protein YsdA (DUF1294 family)